MQSWERCGTEYITLDGSRVWSIGLKTYRVKYCPAIGNIEVSFKQIRYIWRTTNEVSGGSCCLRVNNPVISTASNISETLP